MTQHSARTNRRRIVGALATGTAAALMLAGCGSSGASSSPNGNGETPSKEHVTLRMYASNVSQKAWEAIINGFNASQDHVTVKGEFIPTAKIGQMSITQLQAGSPPDILYASPGSGGGTTGMPVYRLAKAGELVDLSNEPWAPDIPEELKETATVNGKVYSFIYGTAVDDLVYRTNKMKDLGFQPPQSFDQLLQICKGMRAKGQYASVSGGAVMAANRSMMQAFSAANVYKSDPDWDHKRAEGKVTFMGTPGWHAVFQQVVDMVKAECFYPGAAGRDSEGTRALEAQGKGMIGISSSAAYNFTQTAFPSDPLGVAPIPGTAGTVLSLQVNGLSIAAKSKHIPEAKEFLRYFSQHTEDYAQLTGQIAPGNLKSGKAPAFLKGLEPLIKQGEFRPAPGTMWPSTAPAQAAYKTMTGLYTGQTSVDDVLKAMDAAWDAG